jgi:hypothetical protein
MAIAIITAITMIAYFIIKYFKRHTTLLEEFGR